MTQFKMYYRYKDEFIEYMKEKNDYDENEKKNEKIITLKDVNEFVPLSELKYI